MGIFPRSLTTRCPLRYFARMHILPPGSPAPILAPEQYPFVIPALLADTPAHECAYCRSKNTALCEGFEIERGQVFFTIRCLACQKLDRPSIGDKTLRSLLMLVG